MLCMLQTALRSVRCQAREQVIPRGWSYCSRHESWPISESLFFKTELGTALQFLLTQMLRYVYVRAAPPEKRCTEIGQALATRVITLHPHSIAGLKIGSDYSRSQFRHKQHGEEMDQALTSRVITRAARNHQPSRLAEKRLRAVEDAASNVWRCLVFCKAKHRRRR